jgi:hypothetical protein
MKYDTKKKQKSWLSKLFFSTRDPVREDDNRISFSVLRKMARTK